MYLALKPGARCGWAAWSPGDARPICGSFDMPEELGRAGCRMHGALSEINAVHPFESLAYEQPAELSASIGPNHYAEVAMTFGIASHIESYCTHLGRRCRRVGLGAWRGTFLGKGHGERAKTFEKWMNQRFEEFGFYRIRTKEQRIAVGLLDHLILLEGRHESPWRQRLVSAGGGPR